MPDSDMVSLLQAVLDDVCADIPPTEAATRERVAAKRREAAQAEACPVEDLKRVGHGELRRAPTMWR
jgi:hypothetical protein